MTPPSPTTQATLLLTAPLIAGRGTPEADLLSLGEFNRLAELLAASQGGPADLLGPRAGELLEQCRFAFDLHRLRTLLDRGFLLSQAVERWAARSIWVISRADLGYPERLHARLERNAPAILYGVGAAGLLNTGGLAVVGSRDVDLALLDYTQEVGRLCAQAERTVVSGGARGIDQAAMRGALAAGGRAVGVLADGLERAAVERDHLEPIIDGKLTLVSPYDPAVGFNVGHAMQRNKVIYALADAGLVVNSDLGKGGTWAGAVEQLGKARLLPVYVRTGEGTSPGNAALLEHGARPWPEPRDGAALIDLLAAPSPERAEPLVQGELLLATPDSPSSSPARGQTPPAPAAGPAAGARKRHPRAGGRKGG